MANQKTARIAELNDAFRTTGLGGEMFGTSGVCSLSKPTVFRIFEAVKTFDEFTEDNDPHGQHDFGAFEVDQHKLFWKIDYYALDLMHGSEDPSDPKVTTRVLTIMLRSEY